MFLPRHNLPNEAKGRFQSALHTAARLLGWILPETEAEVKAVDQHDRSVRPELPNELRDPLAALDRSHAKEKKREQQKRTAGTMRGRKKSA